MVSPAHLPAELIDGIVSHLPDSSLHSCIPVCKAWHSAVTPRLYAAPSLQSTAAYHAFTETILAAPHLASHVRHLDLSRVSGTQDTSRLPEVLSHMQNSLRTLVMPQAAITSQFLQCLPGLVRLERLDLEHCNDAFELARLVHASAALPKLHTLWLPRCAVSTRTRIKTWPRHLTSFALRGGLRDTFLAELALPTSTGDGEHDGESDAPSTTLPAATGVGSSGHARMRGIERVLVCHAPTLTSPAVLRLLSTWTETLRDVTVMWPMPRFAGNAMDNVLIHCPALERLSLAIDYISARFFEQGSAHLRALVLDYSGVGKRGLVTSDDLLEALELQEHYTVLETLSLTCKAHAQLFSDKDDRETLTRLVEVAQARNVCLDHVE